MCCFCAILLCCVVPQDGQNTGPDLNEIHMAYDRADFARAFRLASEAVWRAEPSDRVSHLFEIMDQCRKNEWYRSRGVTLPSRKEWSEMKSRLSRRECVVFLCNRAFLAVGPPNDPGAVVPPSIHQALLDEAVEDVQPESLNEEIDPFAELLALNLGVSELDIIYPFFSEDWIFRPSPVEEDVSSNCMPAGRYCLCVIVNRACGKPNLIWEYDLSDQEWSDPKKVAELVKSRRLSADRKE